MHKTNIFCDRNKANNTVDILHGKYFVTCGNESCNAFAFPETVCWPRDFLLKGRKNILEEPAKQKGFNFVIHLLIII